MSGLVRERLKDSTISAHPLNRQRSLNRQRYGYTPVMNRAFLSALLSVPAFVHHGRMAWDSLCASLRSAGMGSKESWVVLSRFQVETRTENPEKMHRKNAKRRRNNNWDGAIRDSLVDVSAHSYNARLIHGVEKSERS